jgi:hypothetical protein
MLATASGENGAQKEAQETVIVVFYQQKHK